MSHLAKAPEVFDIELAALKAVRQQLDSAVDVIVESINQRGKIILVGIGKSGHLGREISATLTSKGSTSVMLDSVDALHGDLGVANTRGTLGGVFADGDFRRHMAADEDPLSRPRPKAMTRWPRRRSRVLTSGTSTARSW